MTVPITFLRWKRDEPRESRVLPPLAPGHPMRDAVCLICGEQLGERREVRMLVLGPDVDERQAHDDGRWYAATSLVLHAECVRVPS